MPRILIANPLKRRLPFIRNTVEGILLYGRDNLYPQRMRELIGRSGAGNSSVKLFGKFIRGAGFKDQLLNEFVCNVAKQTIKAVMKEVAEEYSIHYGFAVHVDYNAFLQPINHKVIKFEYCRLGLPDEEGNINKIVVSDDWAHEKQRSYKRRQKVDIFNPDPEVVMAQIQRAGGLQDYKGQILYVTPHANQYPACTFDEVTADVETDAEISIFRENSTTSNFLASQVFELPYEFENQKERDEFHADIANFQGVKNTGRVLVIENPHAPDKPITITGVQVQNNDKLFEWTDLSAQTKIRKNYTQPAILVGDLIPGRLGNTAEIENSVNFYNMFTYDDRDIVADAFKKLFELTPGITSTDFSIQPLTWQMFLASMTSAVGAAPGQPAAPTGNSALAGLSMGNLNKILSIAAKYKAGKLTPDQALTLLLGYGFTTDEANLFLQDAADGSLDGSSNG